LLWQLVHEERSSVGRRIVLVAAAVLAGGTAEDERLFQWLDQQQRTLPERAFAGFLLALGPRRSRAVPNFWTRCLGSQNKAPEVLLGVAVRLAAARFPGTVETAPPLAVDDAGLVAASGFAGLPVPGSYLAKWWDLRQPERHAELCWRGGLLGAAMRWRADAVQVDPALGFARELAQLASEALTPVRLCATWLRARAGQLPFEEPRLDWRQLQVATADPTTAVRLQSWLGPAVLPRDEEPHRLAVAYALTRPVAMVLDESPQWSTEERIKRHVAVALAWRLCGLSGGHAIGAEVPGLGEWGFVRAAANLPVDGAGRSEDPALQQALRLAAAGRLPRPALRAVLEDALWRWGSHPGLVGWQLERQLLRDLVLGGSNAGGGKYQSHVPLDQRYLPSGLDRNDPFFPIGVALYEFLAVPRLPIPAEHRLPG
jgi:hypothetical protein